MTFILLFLRFGNNFIRKNKFAIIRLEADGHMTNPGGALLQNPQQNLATKLTNRGTAAKNQQQRPADKLHKMTTMTINPPTTTIQKKMAPTNPKMAGKVAGNLVLAVLTEKMRRRHRPERFWVILIQTYWAQMILDLFMNHTIARHKSNKQTKHLSIFSMFYSMFHI